jgi:F0F1-type ATP synthase assembly protein I
MNTESQGPGIMVFAGLGMFNAVCLLAGLAGGWFVDHALHTLPLFMLVGLVLGIVVGAFTSRRQLKQYSR